MSRVCTYTPCSKDFIPNRSWQKYCTSSHRLLDYEAKNTQENKVERLFIGTVVQFHQEGLALERMIEIIKSETA